MLDRGSDKDWFSSKEVITEACLAGLGLYIFVVHSLTAPEPFVDFGNLKDRNFAVGMTFASLNNMILTPSLVLIPAFLENLVGDPVGLVGILMTPRSIGMASAMLLAGRLTARFDARILAAGGLIFATVFMVRMSHWSLDIGSSEIMWNGFFQGAGIGFAFASIQGVVFTGIASERRNGAAALYSLGRNFGQSIGTSVTTAMLVWNTGVNHAEIAAHVTPFNRALRSGGAEHFWNWHQLGERSTLNAEVTRQATAIAYFDDFKLLTFVSLVLIPIVFLLRAPRRGARKMSVRKRVA
jgi:DHA2 family multidrug resistance protein